MFMSPEEQKAFFRMQRDAFKMGLEFQSAVLAMMLGGVATKPAVLGNGEKVSQEKSQIPASLHALNTKISEAVGFDIAAMNGLRVETDQVSFANVMLAAQTGFDKESKTPFLEIAAIPSSSKADSTADAFSTARGGRGVTIKMTFDERNQSFLIQTCTHSAYGVPYGQSLQTISTEELRGGFDTLINEAVADCRSKYQMSMFGEANTDKLLASLRAEVHELAPVAEAAPAPAPAAAA